MPGWVLTLSMREIATSSTRFGKRKCFPAPPKKAVQNLRTDKDPATKDTWKPHIKELFAIPIHDLHDTILTFPPNCALFQSGLLFSFAVKR